MMPTKREGLLWILLGLVGLAGCTSSSSHTAYVTLPSRNAIVAFRVDNHSGKMTQIVGSPFTGLDSPTSILVHPSNRFAYVTNQLENDISLFTIDQNTGALTEVMPRTGAGITPVFLVMDAGAHFLFAANQAPNGTISVYTIDSGKGTLHEVAGSPFPTGANPAALAITPSGKYLYVATPNLGFVFGYAVTPGTGNLQAVPSSPFLVGSGPVSVAVDPSEHFVYVANSAASTISALAIDSSGSLVADSVPGSPFPTCRTTTTSCNDSPISVVVHSSGQFLYVANNTSNNVSAYGIASSTGALTLLTNSPFTAGTAPVFASVDSTGKFLFVGNQSSSSITEFNIDSTTGGLPSTAAGASTNSAPTSMFTTR
jgi:6-phosphogluconolactonase